MVIRPDGTLAAKYRKLHPFDVVVPNGPAVRESSQICPGDAIVTVDAGELGTWGLSVCYDLRFGELYRIIDRKSTRQNSSHIRRSRMPSSA